MQAIYTFFLFLYRMAIHIAAFAGNRKAILWLDGRKNIFAGMQQILKPGEERVWFHCASLGEFEQGRPLIEKFRMRFPQYKIVLTFFSPSGYIVRNNYPGADYVFYLPADSKKNAEQFISLVNPVKVFFIKYEYWHYYITSLYQRHIPLYVVSAVFRSKQIFFRWYGSFFRNMLKKVTCFFVQDQETATLLHSLGISQVIVSGDTRFDRVAAVAAVTKSFSMVEAFAQGTSLLVAGSTWPKDEKIICGLFANESIKNSFKLIIAPHEIHEAHLAAMTALFEKIFQRSEIVRFSTEDITSAAHARVLIIDSIGALSSLYRCATASYVGGGFGNGIHNILEAVVYGTPVFFGPNYGRFNEAVALAALGGAFPVKSATMLLQKLQHLLAGGQLQKIRELNIRYVQDRTGATETVLKNL